MPVYAYRCTSCGTSFEQQESLSRHGKDQPHCPDCQSPDVEQRFSDISVRTSKKS